MTQKEQRGSRRSGDSVFRPLPRDKVAWWRFALFLTVFTCAVILVHGFKIGCLIKAVFHIPCPGCGLSRAFVALFKGRWDEAFLGHFMFPAILPAFMLIPWNGRPFRREKWNLALLIFLAAGFLLRWILNLAGVLPA